MKFIGGQLCLDFVNTVGAWAGTGSGRYGDGVKRDKLVSFDDLLTWSRLAGILSKSESLDLARYAAGNPETAAATLTRAVRLRRALYRIFKAVVEGWRPDTADLDIMNAELSVAKSHQRLTYSGGAYAFAWEGRAGALDRPLWPVVRSTAELLTSGELSRVRQCAGENCGWIFLDVSRNQLRQWCDMKDCGNRAKVRRFRQRLLLNRSQGF